MSLRLKFLVLVAGAVLAPVFVFLIAYQFDTQSKSFLEYRNLLALHHAWRNELSESPVEMAELEAFLEEAPESVEVRVFDSRGEMLFSRKPGGFLVSGAQVRITEDIPVTFASGEKGIVVVTRHAGPFFRNDERWYVPLTGFVFTAVMVIVIVQSVNRSISDLEKATRKIAEGNLDFELPIKGRDKLASLTRSFESMREHLKEEYARRSRFIMGISHDLKTPLASVRGYTDAIREGYADTPEKLAKYIGIIEDKTKLLESRIAMLIDYVQRETGEWKLNLQPVEIAPLLAEIATVLESEATLSGRTWLSDNKVPGGIRIPVDEGMFMRAMENLVQNAIRYSPEGSTVRFSCLQAGASLLVAISNEGPGIDPADLPHIFDPFVRGAKDRKGPGFGLGLSTVEAVISSHGWRITVDSQAGETRFTISIPLGDAAS
ncbi:MAG: HAMP domain-containing histidine kinase [Spirochaetales bacterium]|nr:HAMP domain-containing histidine kinase [Spirochaetales bacterium]